MTTLIAVYESDGCRGRCDARCYEATGPDCKCVCGGKNHGKGIDQAIVNTALMAELLIEEFTKKNGIQNPEIRLSPSCIQPILF